MKKWILFIGLFSFSIQAHALRLPNGELITPGDSISSVYQQWGNPSIRATTEKTCGKVITLKETYCSNSRLIWKKGDTYWMFQMRNSMVIKIKWTRNKRYITKKF